MPTLIPLNLYYSRILCLVLYGTEVLLSPPISEGLYDNPQ